MTSISPRRKSTEGDENSAPDLPFVTTSSVLNQLNQQLQSLSGPGEIIEPRFELQKRLPDGSTIPASDSDLAYSDLQTKLQQSATFVAQLKHEDRIQWAEDQRLAGNAYFHRGNYTEAMDVYMTCLVVKEDNAKFVFHTMTPVLNNLAQCTLQLGMLKKTMEFCNIALEELSKHQEKDDGHDGKGRISCDPIAISKLYFKRAKAHRLIGEYGKSRRDIQQSLELISCDHNDDTKATQGDYRAAITKEIRRLDMAEQEARKNRLRTRKAMKQALSSDDHAVSRGKQKAEQSPQPRQYSSLREKPPDSECVKGENRKADDKSPSYSQYYLLLIGRVVEKLLIWLGDEETMRNQANKSR